MSGNASAVDKWTMCAFMLAKIIECATFNDLFGVWKELFLTAIKFTCYIFVLNELSFRWHSVPEKPDVFSNKLRTHKHHIDHYRSFRRHIDRIHYVSRHETVSKFII